jgi:hypothetical protein
MVAVLTVFPVKQVLVELQQVEEGVLGRHARLEGVGARVLLSQQMSQAEYIEVVSLLIPPTPFSMA